MPRSASETKSRLVRVPARYWRWLGTAAIVFVLAFFALVTLAPVYWMVAASFRPQSELFSLDLNWIPRSPTLVNYQDLLEGTRFPRWLFNSIVVALASTVLGIAMGSMAGFAFAKYDFRYKSFLFWLALASVSIPQIVTIIPIFIWFSRIGLTDTYFVLVVPPAVNVFAVFLLRQYISGLSDDMLESARIDGASEWGVYAKIVLPLVRPGLGAAAIFLWVGTWSAYLWPLVMVQSNDKFTLPLGLATLYSNPWDLNYGMLMAGAVLATIPITIAFLLMQEQFISGLTAGAVKG
jgi:ABC-type glycerol-3-phosphate transport system permease component